MADSSRSDRPIFRVRLLSEGAATQALDLSSKVVSFSFLDEERKADRLQLTVDNFDLAEFDNPTWRKGGILEFAWGYPGRTAPPRRAVIQKVTGGTVLTIEAHALSVLTNKVKKARVWNNMRLSDIAKTIAAEYGTSLGVPGGTLAGNIDVDKALDQKVAHRHQAGQTDAEFLTRLARRYGLEFYVDSAGMHFKQRNLKQAPVKTLSWYFTGNGDILSFHIENDLTKKHGKHTLKGFDPLKKKVTSHSADNDSTKRDGLAPVIEIIDERTGKASLQSRVAEETTSHTSEHVSVKHAAEGNYRQTQHMTIHMEIEIIGDPDVTAKRVVVVQGLGKRLSGKYYVQSASHEISSAGYKTKLKCKTDGHGGYGNNNVKSKAALNDKKSGDEQRAIQVLDERTGQFHIEYRRVGDEH